MYLIPTCETCSIQKFLRDRDGFQIIKRKLCSHHWWCTYERNSTNFSFGQLTCSSIRPIQVYWTGKCISGNVSSVVVMLGFFSTKVHGSADIVIHDGFINVTFLVVVLRDFHLLGFNNFDQSRCCIFDITCQSSLYDFCRCLASSNSACHILEKGILWIFF